MSVKILVVAMLSLALAPGAVQAKPNASKGKAPQAKVEQIDDNDAAERNDPVASWLALIDPDALDPSLAPADVKPPTQLPPRPPGETLPDPPAPPASPAPAKGKGHGRACRGLSRRKAPGQRQSPFKRCIEARKDAETPKPRTPVEEREAPVAEQEPGNEGSED